MHLQGSNSVSEQAEIKANFFTFVAKFIVISLFFYGILTDSLFIEFDCRFKANCRHMGPGPFVYRIAQ